MPEYSDELAAAVRAQGHVAKLIEPPSPPYRWDDVGCSYRDSFAKDACVITVGDIELILRLRAEKRWTPGVFANVEQFFCSNYYCKFGQFLLNSDYMMLPFGELSRCREFLLKTLGIDGRIFVRPDSPLKLFTGQVATEGNFDADLELMEFYGFPSNEIVVVSSPKSIIREWRFVVVEGRVITGSEYVVGQEYSYAPATDEGAKEFATRLAQLAGEPDPVWVIDVAQTEAGDYGLMEIGGFSFASLYACDKALVVKAVSQAAEKLWRTA